MNQKKYLQLMFLFLFQLMNAQVGIGTTSPNASSELEIASPLNDKGVLIPRMTQAQRNLIALPATSLLIYQTDNTPGFYYYNGTIWVGITAGASTDWTLLGNAGTTSATNFLAQPTIMILFLNEITFVQGLLVTLIHQQETETLRLEQILY